LSGSGRYVTLTAVDLWQFIARLACGANLNLHRWYDAAIGRWLSEDPLGLAAGDANLYCHIGNLPAAHTDPLGLASAINSWRGTKDG